MVGERPIIIPTGQIVAMFETLPGPFVDRCESNKRQNKARRKVNDLLPRLVANEIRLRDAEQLVARAV